MRHGISTLSIIPVRREPSEKSEMVTQILFGEYFDVKDEFSGWSNIRSAWDGYEGWIDKKMVKILSNNMFSKIALGPYAVCSNLASMISFDDDQSMMIVAGSTLPLWKPELKNFRINRKIFKFSGDVCFGKQTDKRDIVIRQACRYFNSPYFWGGRTPFGIDCSGLSQIIYKMIGVRIPRDAADQANQGQTLEFIEEAKPGDLAFFENDKGRIVHVGIIWQNGKIIHAHGKVRADLIDQTGIFNIGLKRYTHKLCVCKKIIQDNETN
jgi:gamma-D-glutamyl-L-lysine dipeptidyl-peptidase